MKITLVKHTDQSRTRRVLELSLLMDSMKTENQQKPVTRLRQVLPYYRPGERCEPARQLPRILFAIAMRRKSHAPLTVYNGLVLLSVAQLADLREAEALRNQAAELPSTLAAFIGSSGHTVKILVSYCRPDGTLPDERQQMEWFHAHAYRHAARYYQFHLQHDISLRLPGLEEGCRLSYDPDLYYNPQVKPTPLPQPLGMPAEPTYTEVKKEEKDPLTRLMPGYERYKILSVLFHTSLQEAWKHAGKEEDMQPFLLRLARNCYHSGIPEADAVKWTLNHGSLPVKEPEVRLTFRTTYTLSSHFGKKPCMPPEMSLQHQLEDFMKRHYDLRFNSMLETVEYRDRSSFYRNFKPVDERALNSMVIRAQKEGITVWDRDVKRYLRSEQVPLHHPIEEYLDQLPRWDGKDHIRELAARVPCDNPHWPDFFHTWFLSMVAHWKQMDPKHGNSTSPVLTGPQGCGKSSFCIGLLPPELHLFYTDSIDFARKRDVELALHRFALINLDEFDQIDNKHQSYFKNVIQKSAVNTRKAYQTCIERLQCYASFIATSNHTDLLSDLSGSRRFIVVKITGPIDHEQPVDHAQLYAQAVAELRGKARYWFTARDEKVLVESNREFEKQTVDEQLFLHYFRAAEKDEPGARSMQAVEIMEYIQRRSRVKLSHTHLTYFGRVMKKLEIPCRHTREGNFYDVVELNP